MKWGEKKAHEKKKEVISHFARKEYKHKTYILSYWKKKQHIRGQKKWLTSFVCNLSCCVPSFSFSLCLFSFVAAFFSFFITTNIALSLFHQRFSLSPSCQLAKGGKFLLFLPSSKCIYKNFSLSDTNKRYSITLMTTIHEDAKEKRKKEKL